MHELGMNKKIKEEKETDRERYGACDRDEQLPPVRLSLSFCVGVSVGVSADGWERKMES
jgi:hypothetical protein